MYKSMIILSIFIANRLYFEVGEGNADIDMDMAKAWEDLVEIADEAGYALTH